MAGWLIFLGVGFASAVLGCWETMIGEAMIKAIIAEDPDFRPSRFNPDRGWIVREYRQRFPGGELNSKLRRVEWAMVGVSLIFVTWLLAAPALPR